MTVIHGFCSQRHQQAFSLVELAIVLVILGLLVGGVLTGQSLIRASELRSINRQYQSYVTAVHSFRDKYFMLPGDITNATQIWGVAAGTGSDTTCRDFDSTGTTATCNGDGDGFVQYTTAKPMEIFRFWQHLANAGLIEGSYSGMHTSFMNSNNTIANAPAGKISSSLWHAFSNTNYTNSTAMVFGFEREFNLPYGNSLVLTTNAGIAGGGRPILLPNEQWNIDVKIDDGKPGSGKMVVRAMNGLNTCTTAANVTDFAADYLLSSTTVNCAPIFRQAF